MSAITKKTRPAVPTVLVTNDDGPPCAESPFLHSFVHALRTSWAGDVRVVVPNTQRSWIGKAYLIHDRLRGSYYYTPAATGDGTGGEVRPERRAQADGEEEWILLDGTPASCCNIATQCLYPGQIDLVVSGPNLGRNTSSAFALSSGTIGAALDGSLTGIPSIALSYGIFDRPIKDEWVAHAHAIAIKVLRTLWETGFAQEGDADLYSVNIPMVPAILKDPVVVWTTEAITRYGRLFLPAPTDDSPPSGAAGGDARPSPGAVVAAECVPQLAVGPAPAADATALRFAFSPDIAALIDPKATDHAEGTDAEALNRGWCTVSPLRAAFRPATVPLAVNGEWEGRVWKL